MSTVDLHEIHAPDASNIEPGTPKTGLTLAMSVWSVAAAFGAYFCMYAFRKPFTAASFKGGELWGFDQKTVLVTAQVFGYMLSKVIGIRVISEMRPERRAIGILVLIGIAELALIGFGFAPAPLHVACLFLNGLPLGMVFGLVLGFLEGRRNTEALAAGLCASFILADGITKSVGTQLLAAGVSERWMPAAAGGAFALPLLLFVWMLTRIPPPTRHDQDLRSERAPLDASGRSNFVRKHGAGLSMIVAAFLLVTIVRSVRADFMPEIWRGLGTEASAETFTTTEIFVAFGVLLVNGLSVFIIDNRKAFYVSLAVGAFGGALMVFSIVGITQGWISSYLFMVLIGLGLYLPYVAIHTTVFERLIAMTRDRGNLGFLMYVADATGYLGYVAWMLGKGYLPKGSSFLDIFKTTCLVTGVLGFGFLAACGVYFAFRGTSVESESRSDLAGDSV